MDTKVILDNQLLNITLKRLCHQLIENNPTFDDVVLIGIQPRGGFLVDKVADLLLKTKKIKVRKGKLDVTYHRDDFRTRSKPIEASTTEIDFLVEDYKVILVDDVLFTGRTIRAAMDALLSFGRPKKVELMVLVDRRFNRQLPIQPDYTGIDVDTIDEAFVKVEWKEIEDGKDDTVWLMRKKDNTE